MNRTADKMTTPGFTAEAVLNRSQIPIRKTQIVNTPIRTDAVYPQFFGGHYCHWECIPGTGCGYFCQDFPY
jgi:hypothetical protein